MRNNIFYILLDNECYEYLDDNGELTTDILKAERFYNEMSAFHERDVLNEPNEYDVVKVSLQYDLEKIRQKEN